MPRARASAAKKAAPKRAPKKVAKTAKKAPAKKAPAKKAGAKKAARKAAPKKKKWTRNCFNSPWVIHSSLNFKLNSLSSFLSLRLFSNSHSHSSIYFLP